MGEVKKRRDLSLSEKINILKKYDKLSKMSQRNAAAELKISQPLLCKILKQRVEIENAVNKNNNLNSKRNRTGKDPQVESALKLWFSQARELDGRVDGPLMRQKAEELANKMGKNFTATEGWFQRWKRRENIAYKQTRGGQKDVDFKSSENWIENDWTKIAVEISPNDIFNADIDQESENLDIQPHNKTKSEFEGEVTIDNCVKIEQNVTEDVCESVMCKSEIRTSIENEEPEVDMEEQKPPTDSEMRKALEVLRRGVQHRSSDLQPHYNYEIFINNLLKSETNNHR